MRTKEELEIEFLKTKLDRAVCLRMIKLLYIKISIYSSLLCTMLLASLLEAILSGNTIKNGCVRNRPCNGSVGCIQRY